MRLSFAALACLILLSSAPAFAQSNDCSTVPAAMPLRDAVLPPITSELPSTSPLLGSSEGVLAIAYNEAQSVDQVLLRMRIEQCNQMARVLPAPSVVDPNDPATYKPRTEFDNTPWRFNMEQDGKRMTADEFSKWMESKGVRIAKGAAPVPAPVVQPPVVTDGLPPGSEPVPSPVPAPQPAPQPVP